jgi:hypothetical protein
VERLGNFPAAPKPLGYRRAASAALHFLLDRQPLQEDNFDQALKIRALLINLRDRKE